MREKPWFRSSNKHWYIQLGGGQHKLCPGESKNDKASREQAHREWHALVARLGQQAPEEAPARASGSVTVAWLANAFLEHTKLHCEKDTYTTRRSFLKRFVRAEVQGPHSGKVTLGALPATGLKKWALQRWLDQNTHWAGPSRRMAINVVITCMNWGVAQELIASHHLKGFKKPPEGVRDATLTPEQADAVMALVDKSDPFYGFLLAMRLTGARPSEVRRVTAADFREPGLWVLKKHKNSKKTREPRVVYLPPAAAELSRALAAKHPDGPLFRNARNGGPWTGCAVEARFMKLQRRLPFKASAYLFRSCFCTTGLKGGVDVAHMATLLGHKGTSMVMVHYSKLAKEVEHMQAMAQKATGG